MHDQNFWTNRVKESAVLNPVDRTSEVLFGLIMVLSFTGAISASSVEREDVRQLLWAALGCNVAWGLVDAIMYLMNVTVERGHIIRVVKEIHAAKTDEEAGKILRDEMQPAIGNLMTTEELNELSRRLLKLPEPSKKQVMSIQDVWAGIQIFLLVFLCTFPVALPFAFFQKVTVAMRVSNGVAIIMLLIGGFILGGHAGFNRFTTAIIYVFIGVLLVALTMALGG